MKTQSEYKRGARHAWEAIRLGVAPETLLNQARGDIDPDAYTRGWKDQCKDPETELHPPDFVEPPDYAATRGLLIGFSLVGLALCGAAVLKFGWSHVIGAAVFVFALTLYRAARLPS